MVFRVTALIPGENNQGRAKFRRTSGLVLAPNAFKQVNKAWTFPMILLTSSFLSFTNGNFSAETPPQNFPIRDPSPEGWTHLVECKPEVPIVSTNKSLCTILKQARPGGGAGKRWNLVLDTQIWRPINCRSLAMGFCQWGCLSAPRPCRGMQRGLVSTTTLTAMTTATCRNAAPLSA